MTNKPQIPLSGWAMDNIETNRAHDTRRDNDIYKTPSITIFDIDFAILHYLKNEISPQIEHEGRLVDVPVVFSKAEIWSQIQQRGYLRDKKDKLLCPYMVLRKSSMSEDPRFRKLDVNQSPPGNEVLIVPKARNFENRNDRHHELTNSEFSDEFYLSVLPEFYKVEYQLYIYTYKVRQLNQIIQDIIPQSNFVWGDSFRFRTLVGDVTFDTINPTNTERIVQAMIPLTVDGRLQSEFELRKSTIRKAFSIKRVVFNTDKSSFDVEVFDADEDFPNH